MTAATAASALPFPRHAAARSATGIAAHLRKAILDGVYVHGERLPPEREMASAFGSSRSTVREALGMLGHDGLITRRVGSGTFVAWESRGGTADVSDVTSPLELIEARLAVEPTMVRLATRHATPRDLERLTEVLGLIERAGDDPDRFTKWDRQFHELIAEATHNPLIVAVYRQISHVRGHRQWNAVKDKILSHDRIAGYNHDHDELMAALLGRNADAAAAVVTRHLESARSHLMEG